MSAPRSVLDVPCKHANANGWACDAAVGQPCVADYDLPCPAHPERIEAARLHYAIVDLPEIPAPMPVERAAILDAADAGQSRVKPAKPSLIEAPFTPGQVAHLNAYQRAGAGHPFTCGNPSCPRTSADVLIATVRGWICPYCDSTQLWAHAFMADGSRETSLPTPIGYAQAEAFGKMLVEAYGYTERAVGADSASRDAPLDTLFTAPRDAAKAELIAAIDAVRAENAHIRDMLVRYGRIARAPASPANATNEEPPDV
jgi:hypothetical protein